MTRLLLTLAIPATTWACSCMASGPPCEAAWKASAVFLGTVLDISRESAPKDGFLGTHVTFQVAEPFIGMEAYGKEVEIRTGRGGGDCGYPFTAGKSYVVYVYKTKEGLLVSSICSRTSPADGAQADLDYLRSLKKALPSSFVFGVVGNSESGFRYDEGLRMRLPEGIGGATVTLTGSGTSRRLITPEDGTFHFEQLSPGKYTVSVAKEGYSLESGAKELEVHAGGCAYAWEDLVVDRRITGKVTGVDGFPVAGIEVQLVPTRPTQENQLPFPVAEAKTDDTGTYEIRNLRPGEYYLGINLARTPSKEMPYTRYFYPGTEDPSHAGVVVIKRSQGSGTFDFPIPEPQRERIVEGFVFWPGGRPAEEVEILLEDPRWPWQTSTVLATTDPSGHFKISAFDRTEYRIHAVTMARFTNQCVSAGPQSLVPGADLSRPLQLMLTKRGHSAAELTGKGLERWRAGLGL